MNAMLLLSLLGCLIVSSAFAASRRRSATGTMVVKTASGGERRTVRRVIGQTNDPALDVFARRPDGVSVHGALADLSKLSGRLERAGVALSSISTRADRPGQQRSARRLRAGETGEFLPGQALDTYRPDKYYTYEHIVNIINSAACQHKDTVSKFVVGQSHQGRDIYMLKISSDKCGATQKRALFVDGGMHAREWISPAAVLHLLWTVVTGRDARAKRLLDSADVYIVPTLNPDGYAHSWAASRNRYWRKNRSPSACAQSCCGVGTDLNRNFKYHYGGSGASSRPCAQDYKGTGAMSEPESLALAAALRPIAGQVDLYLTVHSFGQLLLVPYGYATGAVPDNYADMMRVARAAAKAVAAVDNQTYTPMNSAELYPASGASDDWARGTLRIPYVYTMEMRPGDVHALDGFAPPAAQAPLAGSELLEAVLAMWREIRAVEAGSRGGSVELS